MLIGHAYPHSGPASKTLLQKATSNSRQQSLHQQINAHMDCTPVNRHIHKAPSDHILPAKNFLYMYGFLRPCPLSIANFNTGSCSPPKLAQASLPKQLKSSLLSSRWSKVNTVGHIHLKFCLLRSFLIVRMSY